MSDTVDGRHRVASVPLWVHQSYLRTRQGFGGDVAIWSASGLGLAYWLGFAEKMRSQFGRHSERLPYVGNYVTP
eukprot:scaffold7362_cov266-Pinguiococcus_pyrenoidosus.AAC.6